MPGDGGLEVAAGFGDALEDAVIILVEDIIDADVEAGAIGEVGLPAGIDVEDDIAVAFFGHGEAACAVGLAAFEVVGDLDAIAKAAVPFRHFQTEIEGEPVGRQ